MIRILTDSATDFTQEELQKLNVRCVPMTIAFGGDTYTDGVDLPQEIAEALRLLVPRVRIFACLDTLEYLARGGRIPKAVADVGMLVKLKPLVTVSPDGLVAMAGKAIGRHRAGDAIMKLMERHPIDPRYPLIPLYTGGRENCIAFLRQTAQAGYACSIEEAVSIGPTIGSHVGPGAFGVAYISA